MANVTYRGSFRAAIQSETNDFDPVRGYIYRAIFRGINQDQMLAIQSDYVQSGVACSLTGSHGVYTLEVVDSTREYTLDDWQLDGNEERLDLFSHPTLLAIFGGNFDSPTANASYEILRQAVEDNSKVSAVYSQFQAAGYSDSDSATIARFYGLYIRGTTEFENDTDGSGYVLKHQTNVSNRWQVNISDFNVGKIYTTAELLSEVQSTALWIKPIEPRLAYKIAHFPAPNPQPNFAWGWKKSRSTESTAANNRVAIQQFYTLALWSTDLYQTF